jgi:hypothetical protein
MTKPITVVTGYVIEGPIEGEAKAGSRFVSARLREDSKIGREWYVRAYSTHARDELASRPAGAFIAVAGPFDARIFTPEGEAPQIAWQITATMFLALAQKVDGEEAAP